MRSIAAVLVGVLLFGFAGCSDSLVGTDEESSSPEFARKKPPPIPKEPSEWPITVTFADRDGDQIRSDSELRDDLTDFSYADGECGVVGNIGNLDDARFDPDWSYKGKHARTCGDPRVQVFEFDDGRPDRDDLGAFMNIDGLCSMAVDEVRTNTNAHFNVCTTLDFEDVRAERTGQTTWTVTADGDAAWAFCRGDGGSWHNMPFELTITAEGVDPCPL